MGLGSVLGGIVGSAIPGVGTVLGGAVGGFLESSYKDKQAADFNSAEAAKTRAWQTDMAGTTYQRTMEDMRKAGLNPMLAYSQGGSSVPTGPVASYPGAVGAAYEQSSAAQAQAGASQMQANTAASIGSATIEKIKADVLNTNTDTDRLKAITENLRVEYQNLVKDGYNKTEIGNHLRAQIDKISAEIPQIHSQSMLNTATAALREVEAVLGKYDIDAASQMGNIGREAGQLQPILQLLIAALRRR